MGIDYFGLDVVAGASGAEVLAGLGLAAVGVARLQHESVDDAVEEHVVVEPFVDEFDEVGLVAGCVAVETHEDVALGGGETHVFVVGVCHRCGSVRGGGCRGLCLCLAGGLGLGVVAAGGEHHSGCR